MKRLRLRLLGAVILFAAYAYAADYLSLRFRFPGNRNPFGTVTITQTYVIHEKNGKTEYQFPPPQDQVCVQSLFPHFGCSPCWYLRRHSQQQIDI